MALPVLTVVLAVASLACVCYGLDNGLGLTPPMGWMSWERYRCRTDCVRYPNSCINEQLYMRMADALVSGGYVAAGYNRVNIDDCWAAKERAADGSLQANATRFPHGIKYLADYMHTRGLKLGIYGDVGTQTCGGYPGSLNHFKQDAQTFADWGIDSLKLDGCNVDVADMSTLYPEMGAALNATGRPILYSCSWPAYLVGSKTIPTNYTLIGIYCNLWRNYADIQDSASSMLGILDWWQTNQKVLVPAAGPGRWNNPDQLIVGDFGLSLTQAQLQMTAWCMLAAPLYMSNDLETIGQDFADILLNKEAIAVNQDPLGHEGYMYQSQDSVAWYVKPLSGNAMAVAVFMTSDSIGSATDVPVDLSAVPGIGTGPWMVRDLWTHQDLGTVTNVTAALPPYGSALFKVTPAAHALL